MARPSWLRSGTTWSSPGSRTDVALVHTRAFASEVFDESVWYAPLDVLTRTLRQAARFPTPDELSALYAARVAGTEARPLRFMAAPPKKKPRRKGEAIVLGELYEGRIVERGEVPTRLDDWHDLFNALAFCAFPRAKWALHARQYGIYGARLVPGATRLPGARTREQDALSLFDEGGLVVCATPDDVRALPNDVDVLDTALVALVQQDRARAVPFGHALYEHLVAGLPPPLAYAHVLAVDVLPPEGALTLADLDAIDGALARTLCDPDLFRAPHRARGLSLAALVRP